MLLLNRERRLNAEHAIRARSSSSNRTRPRTVSGEGVAPAAQKLRTVKTMAKTKTYTVTYERDEKGLWLAHVRGLAGCHTQGRTIAQARERIREAISLFDEHANKAQLEDDVRLPSDVSRLVSAQRSARSEQEVAEAKLRTLNVRAARALTKQVGLSLRDAGELLGASQESVRQWVEAS
jgi:predicted RNase H-like HicB family nuclease